MRLRKKIFAMLIAAVLFCTVNVVAYANDVPDPSRMGSIELTMHMGETIVSGGSMTLYRVGSIQELDGDYSFVLTGDFIASEETLDDIASQRLADKLAVYVSQNDLSGITKNIDSKGKVSFSNLEPGLYLLIQKTAAEGYQKANPFLVSIPILEQDQYVYDVDASPKVELQKESVPKEETPEEPTLPYTGQLNWPIPVLAISGLGLLAFGWLLCLGKKTDRYEK